MHKRFDTSKLPYDAAKQATTPPQKTVDFMRLSAESAREHSRTTEGSPKVAQATDGYSKGSLYELQREQQQQELHLKATGGWHPQDLSHPIPAQRLLGGVITGSEKSTSYFFTAEELKAKNQYSLGIRNDKTSLCNSLYKKLRSRMLSDKTSYTEEDIINDLNNTRQGTAYKKLFGYNTLYNPNESSETHEDVAESSQTESADDRFRHSLLQSLAQHYKNYTNRSLHVSHFEGYIHNFNNARKTNYSTDEMVQLLYDEGYLTS